MSRSLRDVHDSDLVRAAISAVEESALARDLGGTAATAAERPFVARLRVSATLALTEMLGNRSADQLLRELTSAERAVQPADASKAFEKWHAYLTTVGSLGTRPSLDDLLLYSAAGLCAKQQVEVRSILSSFDLSRVASSGHEEWGEHVRRQINVARLLLIRQRDRTDIAESGDAIELLAEEQRANESVWLEAQDAPGREAIALLGYYHLGRAIERTSEFLLAGSVQNGEGAVSTDLGPELRRLLSRADQYLSDSSDMELRLWLNAVTVVLWTLRTDSIWVSGRGISEKMDQLLVELARGERERNVFSLLPSQQEAIRQNFLDPARVAAVLQMPTGSGKTLLSEFAILQTIDAFQGKARIAYLVPTRALATQTFRTLAEDLRPLGIEVFSAASAFEEDPYELELLRGTDGVIVATPEKLDLLLRSHPEWFDDLRLVVVDEAHLLDDSERGVRLELLLANIRRERPEARLLLMTPFLENAKEIAAWLGGERGIPISVQWRPLRLLLALAELKGRGAGTYFSTEWIEPHRPDTVQKTIRIPVGINKSELTSTRSRVAVLDKSFRDLGSTIALFSASKQEPEHLAQQIAGQSKAILEINRPPALRVAIALAREEFGDDSTLAECLARGVAYHHSALSPPLRYLIEDQVRAGTIRFVAATTTLAQGMNFPVSSVLIHSVHKPHGKGNLSSPEFWNIAGRAGRIGWGEKGLVIFANEDHRVHWQRYAKRLSSDVRSALLDVLASAGRPGVRLKDQYREYPELRPFIQYLAHAVAGSSPSQAMDDLEELLQGSLANAQVRMDAEGRAMHSIARRYLTELSGKSMGLVKTADRTGLGSFSFEELFGKIRDSSVLREGPTEVVGKGAEGIQELVEALRWLPELDLAIGKGSGPMDVAAVARVVQGWMDGKRIVDLADDFPGEEQSDRVRKAATYLFSRVSQTIAWGAHAYLRGWLFLQPESFELKETEDAMLPAYVQHGVRSPEAAVMSLLSVPRQLAEPLAHVYRDRHGELSPGEAGNLRRFLEDSSEYVWAEALTQSHLDARPADLRAVWRQMRGLR